MNGRTIKRAALIFLPLAAAAIAVTCLLYASQASAIRSLAEVAETRAAELARQRLVLPIGQVMADASYLAEQNALQEFLANGDEESLRHLQAEYLAFSHHRMYFDQLRFIDLNGQEVVRVNRYGEMARLVPQGQLQNKAGRYYTRETLKLERGQAFISPLDLNIENGQLEVPFKPTIRVGIPVFDDDGARRGLIVVNYLGQRLLERIRELETNQIKIWLLNSDGFWLLGPDAASFAFMFPELTHPRTFASTYPEIWQRIKGSPRTGQFTTDIGRFTFGRADTASERSGDTTPATTPEWFVVIYTPSEALAAQTADLRNHLTAATGAFLLLMAGVSVGLARYQTHRREAEQRIRLSEARFRAVTETASDAIISADSGGRITYFNPAAERIFGHDEAVAIGQPLTILMPERFRKNHLEGMQRYLKSHQPKVVGTTVELVGQRGDGHEFPIDLALASSQVDHGVFFTAIIRDITARAASEAQIKDLNRRLQLDNAELAAVNKELEAFSYSVSHDLRAPLRAIDGFSQALIEDAGPLLKAEHHSHLNRVRQAAQRMGLLIDDLIKLARVTRMDVKIEDVDLSGMAEQITNGLQDSAPERQAEFVIAPHLRAKGDTRLLHVVLENLLNNSWKFTAPRSPARIECGQAEIDGIPAFFVRDNGVGFDMSYASKMFGAFQRFHDSREFAGTGIGLATVQRIIHKHGGRIWAKSQPGEGATFYFTL